MQAKLEVENDTKVDGSGLFPDGAKIKWRYAGNISYRYFLSGFTKIKSGNWL